MGPNGQGKTTLLLHLAHKRLAVPAHIDVLMVEQEVAAGEASALEMVLAADTVTQELEREREEIERAGADADGFHAQAQQRLEEVYAELRLSIDLSIYLSIYRCIYIHTHIISIYLSI